MGCSATQSSKKQHYKSAERISSTQSFQLQSNINIHPYDQISKKDIHLEIQDNLGEYKKIPAKKNGQNRLSSKIQKDASNGYQSHKVNKKKSQFFNSKNELQQQVADGVTLSHNKNKKIIQDTLIEINNENSHSWISLCKNKKLEVNALDIKIISNINHHYKFERLIAKGNFGSAYLATSLQVSPGQKVIVKKILKDNEHFRRQQEDFIQEINILKKVDHQFIVRSLDFLEDAKNFYIIQEYLSGGTLRNKINEGFFQQKENEAFAAQIILQILQALNYLHKTVHVIHRDIKPENFVFQDSTFSVIKLIDFGNATEFKPNQKFSSQTGTPYYLSPDVINRNYNEKSDIWSLGIVFMFMMTKVRPYDAETIDELINHIRDHPVDFQEHAWKDFQGEALKFAKVMLAKDPDERPSAHALLKSDWIEKFKPRISVQKQFLRNILENQKENFYQRQTSIISLIKQYILFNLMSPLPKQNYQISSFQALDPFSQGLITKKYLAKGFKKCYPQEIDEAQETLVSIFQDFKKEEQFLTFSEFLILSTQSTDILTIDNLVAFFNLFCDKQFSMFSFSDFIQTFKINSSLELYEEQFFKIFKSLQVNLDQFLEKIFSRKL